MSDTPKRAKKKFSWESGWGKTVNDPERAPRTQKFVFIRTASWFNLAAA